MGRTVIAIGAIPTGGRCRAFATIIAFAVIGKVARVVFCSRRTTAGLGKTGIVAAARGRRTGIITHVHNAAAAVATKGKNIRTEAAGRAYIRTGVLAGPVVAALHTDTIGIIACEITGTVAWFAAWSTLCLEAPLLSISTAFDDGAGCAGVTLR